MNCAVSLARKFDARLTSVHVMPNATEDPQIITRFEESFIRRLQELLPAPTDISFKQEFRVEFGPAADCILKAAAESATDLIVMGVHGAASLARVGHHFGTTAYQVVSEARCPVLTVRGPLNAHLQASDRTDR